VIRKNTPLVLVTLMLSACQAATMTGSLAQRGSNVAYTPAAAPEGAPSGSCWGIDESPAVLETVTEQILVQSEIRAEDGSVTSPAIYSTQTHQKIVQPRQELRFQTPCANQLDHEFLSSLQRALIVRGFYRGPISGVLDARTRTAIRAYQAPQGRDSSIIALDTARQLGLIAYDLRAE
jgi:Putative peptidoglycan binding domain